MAKASVLWLVGEYCALVPKIAPDVLRKAAKGFTEEVRPALTLTLMAELTVHCLMAHTGGDSETSDN